MVNIDGAARMARFLPGCYTRNRFTADQYEAYTEFVRAPLGYFGLTRGKDLYLTDEQLRIWTRERGGLLGQLWSDQGVDLWEDWKNFRAPESRALRDLLDEIRPACVFEMHCHEIPTAMYVPLPSAQGIDRRVQHEYGEEMMTVLMEAGIPCSRHSVRTYHFPDDLHQFPDVVYQRYGCLTLFGEVCFGLTLDRQREQLLRGQPLRGQPAPARRRRPGAHAGGGAARRLALAPDSGRHGRAARVPVGGPPSTAAERPTSSVDEGWVRARSGAAAGVRPVYSWRRAWSVRASIATGSATRRSWPSWRGCSTRTGW